MKRLNILIAIVIATLFVACSKPTLEDKAKERIKMHMDNAFGDKTKTMTLSNLETIFTDDSVCVVQYSVDCKNFSGDEATLRMEYYIMWTAVKDKSLVESFYVLDTKKSLLDRVANFCDGSLPKEESERSHALRVFGPAIDSFSLKTVTE